MAKEGFEVLHEFVEPARQALSKETWDYLMGGAETETTLERNRMAIEALAFRPRVLRNVEKVDVRGRLLGHTIRLPVVLAPIGSLQDLCPAGGVAPAKAAATFGVMHMLSSVCKPGLEEVAAAVPKGHPKLFQLYVRGNPDWVDERLAAAVAHGYTGLALTVDLDAYGRRERDLAKRYKPTARRTSGGGSNDPFQARFSWEDIKRIKSKFKIPMILKGIATAEDAIVAIDHGVEVVYVSNHGGRQLDYGRGAIDVLPEVVEAVRGRAEVMVDGGFMRGSDIVKAIALGAKAVGMGRMQGLALAAGGEAGVVRMLEILETEMLSVLGLLGVTSFAELDQRYIARDKAVERHGLDSHFPLIKDGY